MPRQKRPPEPPAVPPSIRPEELAQYEEACELLRHHSGLRFRQLTIFVAINGGLVFALFRLGLAVPLAQLYGFVGLGILSALAFIILEFRLNSYLDHYRSIVTAYEERFGLSFRLHDPALRGWLIRGRLAVFLFIMSAIGVWALVALMAASAPNASFPPVAGS